MQRPVYSVRLYPRVDVEFAVERRPNLNGEFAIRECESRE
jgi:hypothetical protein